MAEQERPGQGDGEPDGADGRREETAQPDADRREVGEPTGGGDGGERRSAWEPTAEPPDGVDVLVWRLAYQLYTDHRAHTDNFCVTCRQFWPCSVRRFAESALTNALNPGGRKHNGEAGPERG
ncbi:hypothetical protein [Spirilliplanes yamanashiensis]|uniref:Uncharacterized protein n=1 Tax=Spirilliplanes yamanashiensis TaxID=42233 RepID=A0A8J3Y4T1_9ACTN|nr:hypothetical protein [Spirilliplanes yamanashiensis]MDP9819691.1 hypothetical protein [Spirilliplanes yamanashiensis]GIJ01489.1 hypothetical protein Sya03_08410 [Spirilliplanes yamanashiensis]